MSRHRNYCFTSWQIPTIEIDNNITYFIHGEEVCPETKQTHWQGYIELKNPKSLNACKKLFNDNTIHLEPRYGSQKDAIEYCKKDGKWVEFGEKKNQGERTDLKKLAIALLEGKMTLEEVIIEDPETYCKYRNGLKDIAGIAQKNLSKEFRQLDVEVIWGNAGSGKTRSAVESTEDYYILNSPSGDTVWWDGYNGESTLIIDDFYGWIKYSDLLRILDGYQLRLNIKGSFTYARWTKVIITSNDRPEFWYKIGLTPALARRINKCTEVPPGNTKQGVPDYL